MSRRNLGFILLGVGLLITLVGVIGLLSDDEAGDAASPPTTLTSTI